MSRRFLWDWQKENNETLRDQYVQKRRKVPLAYACRVAHECAAAMAVESGAMISHWEDRRSGHCVIYRRRAVDMGRCPAPTSSRRSIEEVNIATISSSQTPIW
jgi:hypothetical protein